MSVQGWVLGVGALGVATLAWAVWVSRREGEALAARRLAGAAVLLSLLVLLAGFGEGEAARILGWVLLGGTITGLFLILIPLQGEGVILGEPKAGVDERDIMFSRAALVPGSERFEAYYRTHPEHRTADDFFRLEPGLLQPGTTQFHTVGFAAADAAFWTIELLRPYAEGGGTEGGGAGIPGPGPGSPGSGEAARAGSYRGGTAPDAVDPEAITDFLKEWTLKCGAHSAGVTRLRDYHLYSHIGRGEGWGSPVRLDHPWALALTVEMDREMVDRAPGSPTVMESARRYLEAGVMAIQLAELIRRLGFQARAHVDGSYRVICPLVARDAGLGEIGRMGLLMTPRLGPRVRIAVVTTDLPLAPDQPLDDTSTLDFCMRCRKCAECCPSRALPFGDPESDERGIRRWKIDAEACFTLWTKMGTDCARCMAVCPYSHQDNLLHDLVRRGIRHNALFRRMAVGMDDLVYGRRPAPKPLPPWMDGLEAGSDSSRRGRGMGGDR